MLVAREVSRDNNTYYRVGNANPPVDHDMMLCSRTCAHCLQIRKSDVSSTYRADGKMQNTRETCTRPHVLRLMTQQDEVKSSVSNKAYGKIVARVLVLKQLNPILRILIFPWKFNACDHRLTACLTPSLCGPSRIHTTASHSSLPASAAPSAAAVHTRAPGSDRPLLAANTTPARWPTRARCQVRFCVLVVCSMLVLPSRCGSVLLWLFFSHGQSSFTCTQASGLVSAACGGYSRQQPSCVACVRSVARDQQTEGNC
jgi:hypothetical protein